MITQLDNVTWILLVIVGLFVAGGFLVALIIKITGFRRELRYIEREIARTEGSERSHWQRKKQKLWLSLLPSYRW